MNAAFWYSLTAEQQKVLLSMYDEPCPLHPQRIEEKAASTPALKLDTLEALNRLHSMGLIYHTGPFWSLTKEGIALIRARAER